MAATGQLSTFDDVWVPIISAGIGAGIGSAVTFFSPKLWRLFEQRYVNPKTALRESLLERAEWWAIKQTDIDALRLCANDKATECRDKAAQSARWAEQVGDKVFSPPK